MSPSLIIASSESKEVLNVGRVVLLLVLFWSDSRFQYGYLELGS